MGRTHAASGVTIALGWTAAGLPLAPSGAGGIAAFAAVTAGAALLPDLDHPHGTLAHSFGPLTRPLAHLTARLSGGHRKGTHTLAFAVLAGLAGHWAGQEGSWWAVVPVAVAVWLALASLAPRLFRGLRNEAAGLAVGLLAWQGTLDVRWLGIALGLGCLAHCLGDLLTPQAFRFLWPLPQRMALGLFTTDTAPERVLAFGLAVANLALFLTVAGWWDGLSVAVRSAVAA